MAKAAPPLRSEAGLQLYRRLLGYLTPYRKVFLVGVLFMVLAALCDAGFAAMLKPLMDQGIIGQDPEFARILPSVIIAILLARGVFGFINQYSVSWAGRWIVHDIRAQMFERLLYLPTSYFDQESDAALTTRLIYNVEQLAIAATDAVRVLVKDTLTVVALLGWMAWLNWKLTCIILVLTPLIGLVVRVSSLRFRSTSRGVQESLGGIADVALQALEGQRIVKVFGGYDTEKNAFEEANTRNRHQFMKRAAVSAATLPVLMLILGLALAIVVSIVMRQGGSGVSAGTFVSYLGALMMMIGPIKRLAKVNETIQSGLAAAESAFAIIDHDTEIDNGTRTLNSCRGAVEFANLSFEYSQTTVAVLHHVSFCVNPGETVALVGRSGSGKTTLVSLLLRFYEPSGGDILLDDVPIADLGLAAYRDNVSLVTQQTLLFDATVAQNIAYGQKSTHDATEIDMEKVAHAADVAHVTEFARNLPQGLNTPIGKDGNQLSGGQRQRIAIARAIYKDAPVLILDEATSSLDTESERLVQDALEKLMRDRTTIVIAHRLSTVEHADKIVVLDGGHIVETGSHRELITRSGPYSRLHQIQSSGATELETQ